MGILQNYNAELQARCRTLHAAWIAPRNVEAAQPNAIHESLANAEQLAHRCLVEGEQARNRIEAHNAEAADPPVVPDSQRHRRMPATWLLGERSRIRFSKQVDDDVAARQLGVDVMGLDEADDDDQDYSSRPEPQDFNDSKPSRDEQVEPYDEEEEYDPNEEPVEGFSDTTGLSDEWETDEDGSNESSHDSDEQNEPDDEDDSPEYRWISQLELGGGLSRGFIWTKVDRDNHIRDVSSVLCGRTVD